MQIVLMRHGEAYPAVNGTDETRLLTPQGHQQAEQTAAMLKDTIKPDVFIVSPLTRAQQTLQHLQFYFPNIPVIISDAIKPDDNAIVALDKIQDIEIKGQYQTMVVVCHMNIIAYLDQLLTAQATLHHFELAEARLYQLQTIAQGLAQMQLQFIPK